MTAVDYSDEDLCALSRLRVAVEAAGDLVYDWDLATDSLNWLGGNEILFGPGPVELPHCGELYHQLINPEDLNSRMTALSDHFSGAAGYDCEYRVRSAAGEFQWIHDRGAVQFSAAGAPMRLMGSLRLVTSRKEHEAELEQQANFDELTGHFNKSRLREALEHALSYSIRIGRPAAFLMVGLDQLGLINTAYGTEIGDQVLIEVARRIDDTLRASDVVGRPGGDRFGILLSSADLEEAQTTAERILNCLRGMHISAGGHSLTVSASIGIVEIPAHSQTSFDVMAKAESAMLKAKSNGRDCVEIYRLTEAQRIDFRASFDTGERVKQALRDNRLVLALQPIVDAQSLGKKYYECLVRIVAEDGSYLPAAEFIPVVEKLGLMRTIDRHVLGLVIAELERQPDLVLAMNISGLTATDQSWLRVLKSHVKGRRSLARRLMIEITETAALQDIEESARFVSKVRELGCKVALDDFGAGYITFRHMKALTVDVVKIDGSFISGILDSNENQLFVRNLLSLARALGVSTVGECVETLEVAEFLAAEGVDYLQGYYFGKPEVWAKTSQRDGGGQDTAGQVPEAQMKAAGSAQR